MPVLKAELHEREAFRAVFSFRQPLEQLDPTEVGNLDKAIANAEAFAAEVIGLLQGRAGGLAGKRTKREGGLT